MTKLMTVAGVFMVITCGSAFAQNVIDDEVILSGHHNQSTVVGGQGPVVPSKRSTITCCFTPPNTVDIPPVPIPPSPPDPSPIGTVPNN